MTRHVWTKVRTIGQKLSDSICIEIAKIDLGYTFERWIGRIEGAVRIAKKLADEIISPIAASSPAGNAGFLTINTSE